MICDPEVGIEVPLPHWKPLPAQEFAPDEDHDSVVPPSTAAGFGLAESETDGGETVVTVTDLAALPAAFEQVIVNVRDDGPTMA